MQPGVHFISRAFPSYASPQLTVSLQEWSALLVSVEFWEWALKISHASITGVKIFLRVIWIENASFLSFLTFLPLFTGKNHGEKKTKKKNFTRKATPDSWGCWIFFFLFFFYLHPQPFFSLNTFHWGKGIWATWALALFLEARGANDHLYNWHDPVGTSQKLSHVICVPMDSCHSKGPPRMSWCPLIHLSHVSQRVLEQAFFVSPNK